MASPDSRPPAPADVAQSSSLIEEIHLPHLPKSMPIYVALYRDVPEANSKFLREQLLQGNEKFEYAFVDASMIISRRHVLAAIFRAINDHLNDRLKSRNVHSEIVFSLSSNNNIGEAFRRFGITDTTKDLLVVKVTTTPQVTREGVEQHLNDNIQGQIISFSDEQLQSITDLARVKKVHKLISVGEGKAAKGAKTKARTTEIQGRKETSDDGGQREENGRTTENGVNPAPIKRDERREIEVQVLGLMALKGAA